MLISQRKAAKMIKRLKEEFLFDGLNDHKDDYLRQDKMKVYKSMKGPEKVKIAPLYNPMAVKFGGKSSLWRAHKRSAQHVKRHVVAVNSSGDEGLAHPTVLHCDRNYFGLVLLPAHPPNHCGIQPQTFKKKH